MRLASCPVEEALLRDQEEMLLSLRSKVQAQASGPRVISLVQLVVMLNVVLSYLYWDVGHKMIHI